VDNYLETPPSIVNEGIGIGNNRTVIEVTHKNNTSNLQVPDFAAFDVSGW
jgi:hypothetical protein